MTLTESEIFAFINFAVQKTKQLFSEDFSKKIAAADEKDGDYELNFCPINPRAVSADIKRFFDSSCLRVERYKRSW